MIGALLLGLATSLAAPQSTAGAGPPARARAPVDAAAIEEVRQRWREALELDVPAEVVADGTWVEGAVDPDPELVALFARALATAGFETQADALLAQSAAPPIVLARVRLALDRDEIGRAIAELEPPSGAADRVRFPAEAEAFLLLGRAHARAGALARAEPLLAEFVKRAPWHVEAPFAWFVLVDAARARGDAAETARRETARSKSAEWHAFYRARRIQVRAQPNEPLPRLGLAQLWLAARELDRARAAVESALSLDPGFCRGLELAAEIERQAGRAADARRRAEAALACDARLVEVHWTLARLARDAGDAGRADEHLARYRALGGTKDP